MRKSVEGGSWIVGMACLTSRVFYNMQQLFVSDQTMRLNIMTIVFIVPVFDCLSKKIKTVNFSKIWRCFNVSKSYCQFYIYSYRRTACLLHSCQHLKYKTMLSQGFQNMVSDTEDNFHTLFRGKQLKLFMEMKHLFTEIDTSTLLSYS